MKEMQRAFNASENLTHPKIYFHKEDECGSSLPQRGAIEAGSCPKQVPHDLFVCFEEMVTGQKFVFYFIGAVIGNGTGSDVEI